MPRQPSVSGLRLVLGLVKLTLCWGAISAPTSCEITQSSITATNPMETSVSVTSNEKKVTFTLQANIQGTCQSSTGETSWVSGTAERSYYVQGIDSTNSKTGETFYGVEVKEDGENDEFKYGARWTNQPCVEDKGTWTAGRAMSPLEKGIG